MQEKVRYVLEIVIQKTQATQVVGYKLLMLHNHKTQERVMSDITTNQNLKFTY